MSLSSRPSRRDEAKKKSPLDFGVNSIFFLFVETFECPLALIAHFSTFRLCFYRSIKSKSLKSHYHKTPRIIIRNSTDCNDQCILEQRFSRQSVYNERNTGRVYFKFTFVY